MGEFRYSLLVGPSSIAGLRSSRLTEVLVGRPDCLTDDTINFQCTTRHTSETIQYLREEYKRKIGDMRWNCGLRNLDLILNLNKILNVKLNNIR